MPERFRVATSYLVFRYVVTAGRYPTGNASDIDIGALGGQIERPHEISDPPAIGQEVQLVVPRQHRFEREVAAFTQSFEAATLGFVGRLQNSLRIVPTAALLLSNLVRVEPFPDDPPTSFTASTNEVLPEPFGPATISTSGCRNLITAAPLGSLEPQS